MRRLLAFAACGLLLCLLHAGTALSQTTIEAETMSLTGYVAQGSLIRIPRGVSTGTAARGFPGSTGTYNIEVRVRLDSNGQSRVDLYRSTTLLASYVYPPGSGAASFTANNVAVSSGETLSLVGNVSDRGQARVDKIVFTSVASPPPTVSLSASPASITAGQSSTVTWSSTNASSCTASGAWSGSRATSGSEIVSPSSTSTYTLTCTGSGGSASQSATVTVTAAAAPTVSLTASPASITAGQSSTLTWSSTNAASCTASGAWSGSRATSGSEIASPGSTSTYTLTCTGSGGSASQSATVTVSAPAPTVSLGASPTSISAGQSATLTWSSTDATSCTASGAWTGTKAISGSEIVSPASTSTYTLSCTGSGGTASQSVTVTVTAAAPTVSLTASPASISAGQSSTLTWSSANATSCTASGGWSGAKAISGSETVSPTSTSTYTLTCTGDGGSTSQSATVTVATAAPTVLLTASPASITAGQSSTLTWSSTDATSCTASGAWTGTKATSGSESVSPTSTSTYTLTCTGSGGSTSQSTTVTVATATPTVSLGASPTSISAGESSTLTWSSTNASSCSASEGWSGSKALSGSESLSPSATTTYILTCTGTGGTASQSATVTVASSAATVSLTASPSSISAGQSSTLTWSTSDATSCTASGAWSGSKATSGSESVSPTSTSTYTLTCSGSGTASASATVTVSDALPVIPGASGFGMYTPAGRGGTVYRVTNLDTSGTGSLAACVTAGGPRVCVFEISGTIDLSGNLTVRNPYITIAGQTAPSPGITLRGATLVIATHDVLVQHLRIRVGDAKKGPAPDNRDALGIETATSETYNVVVDHVSLSWAIDENVSFWGTGPDVYDVTLRNSIISEGLNCSIHPDGCHSDGAIVGLNAKRITLVNNLMAYNASRNPLIRDDSTDVMVVNNLIYRSQGGTADQIYFGSRGAADIPMNASVVGNSFILAPGLSPTFTIAISSQSATSFRLYQTDNLGPLASSDPWSVVDTGGRSIASIEATTPPVWSAGLAPMDARDVEAHTLQYAGARPLDRDAVDERVVANVRARTGDIIDSQSQVGGWPTLAVNTRVLDLPPDPDGIAASGYTNLEEWLHEYSRSVEGTP